MKKNTTKGNVGSRLYKEGIVGKEKREEFSKKEQAIYQQGAKAHQLEEKLHVNTWSCASCGTYHELKSVKIKSYFNSTDIKKICDKCQWDQSKRKPFKVIEFHPSVHHSHSHYANFIN